MGTQDAGVVPGSLDVDLGDVVEVIEELVFSLLLNISQSKLITDHVLLSDSKGSDIVKVLWFVGSILDQVERLLGSVRSLSADLVDILDILSVPGHVVVSLVVLVSRCTRQKA